MLALSAIVPAWLFLVESPRHRVLVLSAVVAADLFDIFSTGRCGVFWCCQQRFLLAISGRGRFSAGGGADFCCCPWRFTAAHFRNLALLEAVFFGATGGCLLMSVFG